jgi:hypothetical protein
MWGQQMLQKNANSPPKFPNFFCIEGLQREAGSSCNSQPAVAE